MTPNLSQSTQRLVRSFHNPRCMKNTTMNSPKSERDDMAIRYTRVNGFAVHKPRVGE